MAGKSVPPGHTEAMQPKQQPEINTAALCQMGQDIVQELVQKVSDAFQNFKQMQLPNGTTPSVRNMQGISKKIAESLTQIEACFRKLRQVYRECQRKMPDDVDPCLLIPYVNTKIDSDDIMPAELPMQKSNKEVVLEKKKADLEEILRAKNNQLKMLVEQTRHLVWEVNSILTLQEDL